MLLMLSGGQGSSQQACGCIEVELSMMKALQVNLSQTQKILQDYGQRFEEENTRYVNLSRAMAQAESEIKNSITEADRQRYLLSVQGSDLEQLNLLKVQNYERLDFETRKLRSTTELVDNLKRQLLELQRFESQQRRVLRRSASGQISVSNSHTCLLGREGKLRCWGGNDYQQSQAPAYLDNARIWQVATGDGQTCVIVSEILSNVRVGQQASREIRCWGNNVFGKSNPPKLEHVSYISIGGAHACAIYTSGQDRADRSFGMPSGQVACWGWNASGQLGVPQGLSVKEISCGFSHTCALNALGRILCWGNPAEGRLDSPTGLGFYVITAAGHAHTCAIDQQGQPVCWGSEEMLDESKLKEVRQDSITESLSCGSGHTCVINAVGRLTCFGKGSARLYSTSQPAAGGSAPLQSAECVQGGCGGWTFICEKMLQKIDTSCMTNATVQLAPTGPLLFVHVGFNAACGAERVSGRVICWGEVYQSVPRTDVMQNTSRFFAPEDAQVCTGWPWEAPLGMSAIDGAKKLNGKGEEQPPSSSSQLVISSHFSAPMLQPFPGNGQPDSAANNQLISRKTEKMMGRRGSYTTAEGKILSLRRLWEEIDVKRSRTVLSMSFLRYLFFVTIYLIALYHQKNGKDACNINVTFKDYFNSPLMDSTRGQFRFEDIRTTDELWTWLERKFVPLYYDLFWSNGEAKIDFYKSALLDHNRIANGLRLTQRRAALNKCSPTAKYVPFFPYCYPSLEAGGVESRQPFGPYYNDQKYRYTTFPSQGEDNGFVIKLPFNYNDTLTQLRSLKADRWIDEATQWWRLDFATFNPSVNMFAQIELIVEFTTFGRVKPKIEISSMRSEVYMNKNRDYVQIVLEILVMMGIIMYVVGDVKDFLIHRAAGKVYTQFLGSFWIIIDILQFTFFFMDFVLWMIVIADPVRRDIKVQLGPIIEGARRDVSLDMLQMHNTTLSLMPAAYNSNNYFVVQSFTVLLTLMRFLKYMAMSTMTAGLIETFLVMKVYLLQYIILVCVCNVGFAYVGYLLFGHALLEFATFNSSYFTLFATLLGEGIKYSDLHAVNPTGAPILYIPFVVFYVFIVLQLVVGIIMESYQVYMANRTRHVDIVHQILYGFARALSFFRSFVDPEETYRYDGPDAGQLREWLETTDFTEETEVTQQQLYELLRPHNVTREDVAFIFKRYSYCTREQDPPMPEPEVNDMVRELYKQIKVLSESQSVVHRKLDSILSGQNM
ncbi:hypothetical protein GUITHDRAFT_116110 [Guillardia theta CCMP2712]|uniref:Uncharacterized protein n=1 Tax=Guillardia theta (strain CCMP2712) TaxID=905079 RepID=L1INH8_GUITC|nr:hypothetical protein GUITHDRAFT_116110 [Guillardia theta CCMP2712]EKX37803.1 hypothetical protein GUITHDRAFT_116110 [Guillardia theta CCMP2712]|eukprot:XP_005824783.1 hypothetical protein GUITHDRAFT_116110 [Guillardia theta CCMP2712]